MVMSFIECFKLFSFRRINALFILMDALTAVVLGRLAKILAKNLLKDQAKNAKTYHVVKFFKFFYYRISKLFFKHFYP